MKKTCAFLVLAFSFFALVGCERNKTQVTTPKKTTKTPSKSTTKATTTEDPVPVENVTLYVKNNGLDSNDGLTEETATSLKSAVEKVRSGDKIILLSGTYTLDKMVTIKKSGSEIKRNELIGQGEVVFDFINTKDDDISRNGGISIEGSYWKVDNIKVYNSDNYGFEIKGSGCKINNCISSKNCDGGFFIDNASLTTITNCISSDNNYPGNSASGFYISGNGSNNVIDSCVSNNNQDSGFVALSSKGVTFNKCLAIDNGFDNSSQKSGFVFNNKGHSFYNCIAYNNALTGFVVPIQYSDKGSYILNNCSSINNHYNNFWLRKSSTDVITISNVLSFNNNYAIVEGIRTATFKKDFVSGNVKNSVFLYDGDFDKYSYVLENPNYSSSNPSDTNPIDFSKYLPTAYTINLVVPEEMKEYIDPDLKAEIEAQAEALGVEPDYSSLEYKIVYFKDGKLNIYDYLDRCTDFQDVYFETEIPPSKKPGYFGAYVNEVSE